MEFYIGSLIFLGVKRSAIGGGSVHLSLPNPSKPGSQPGFLECAASAGGESTDSEWSPPASADTELWPPFLLEAVFQLMFIAPYFQSSLDFVSR